MARLVTERGRMNKEEEEIIVKHSEAIESELDAKDVTGPLFSRFIIDDHDKASIEIGSSRIDRTKLLINCLILRGPNAFNGFIECLEAKGYLKLADRLKGETSVEVGQSDQLRNWRQGQYLTEKFDILRKRIVNVEKRKVSEETVQNLSDRVELMSTDIDDIKRIVTRVEELSRASKQSENTISLLSENLKEKEKLLSEARKKIDELEEKVEDLERINSELRMDLDKQIQRVNELEITSDKQKSDIDQLRQVSEKDRVRNAELMREQDKKRREFEAEQKREMQEFKEGFLKRMPRPVVNPQPPRRQTGMRTKIEPQNRFQPDRKYTK